MSAENVALSIIYKVVAQFFGGQSFIIRRRSYFGIPEFKELLLWFKI